MGTLFFTCGGVITTGLPLYAKLPHDPMRDFAPVAMLAHVPGDVAAEVLRMARERKSGVDVPVGH